MRFVRRRSYGGGSKPLPALYRLFALVAAAALAATAIGAPVAPLSGLVGRVDGAVLEQLMTQGSATAYVTVEGGVLRGYAMLEEWVFGSTRVYKVRLSSVDELARLLADPRVVSVYAAKPVVHAPLYWLDPASYPNISTIDIDNVFHEAYGPWSGRNVTVAVIDTGIDYTHPDFYDERNETIIEALVSVLYVTRDGRPIVWLPGVNGTMDQLLDFDMMLWRQYGEPAFLDVNGHGTHVAGIIAGQGRASNGLFKGIAPGARLVVIKAFNRDGLSSLDLCLTALEWVYNYSGLFGIRILSLSWGAAVYPDGRDPLSRAVDAIVRDRGVWVFAAAGNEGNVPTTIVAPAAARLALAVGAWDAWYDRLAPFSSLGPTADLRMKPDLVASGVMVVAPASRYARFPEEYMVGSYYVALSGTSMATPAAAAVAAVFVEYYRYWYGRDPSLEDFIRWVAENGKRISPVKDFVTGLGIPVAPHA